MCLGRSGERKSRVGGEEAASSCFARDVSATMGARFIPCAVGNCWVCREAGDLIYSLERLMQTAPWRIVLLRRKKEVGEQLLGFWKRTWKLTVAEGEVVVKDAEVQHVF